MGIVFKAEGSDSAQGQSRFLGSPGSFLYVRLYGLGDVRALFFIYGK